MDGDGPSKVGHRRETGENMLSSRFNAHDLIRTFDCQLGRARPLPGAKSRAPTNGSIRIRGPSLGEALANQHYNPHFWFEGLSDGVLRRRPSRSSAASDGEPARACVNDTSLTERLPPHRCASLIDAKPAGSGDRELCVGGQHDFENPAGRSHLLSIRLRTEWPPHPQFTGRAAALCRSTRRVRRWSDRAILLPSARL
jgi:hypothetical protein